MKKAFLFIILIYSGPASHAAEFFAGISAQKSTLFNSENDSYTDLEEFKAGFCRLKGMILMLHR